MKRIVGFVVLSAIILWGGTGCMNQKKNINDMALEYMEEKYGEKFEYVCPWGNSMTGTHQLLVTCNGLDGQDVLVEIENFRTDQRVFRDNYLAVKYQMNVKNYFMECANKVFGKSVVFHIATKQALSADLPPDATFEEFLADPNSFLVATIVVDETSYSSKNQVSVLLESISTSCNAQNMKVETVIVKSSDFNIMDKDVFNNLVDSDSYIQCATMTRSDGEMGIHWMREE